MALGTRDGGVSRFSVKYGSATRWRESSVADQWELPNGNTDPKALPLACAQYNADPSSYSEDCLSAILYVPSSVMDLSGAPTFVWMHGGSFMYGSATNPGLDGAALSKASRSIVAVVQYRLGALGFMAPSGITNLAVKDILTCLQFLAKVLPSFGGDPSKITVAGQSSGANMARALLATPFASSYFRSAILQSDPMDYGFLTQSMQSTLQAHFNSMLNCTSTSTNTSCLEAIPLSTVLDISFRYASEAVTIQVPATSAEPMRPVNDGSFITSTLDSSMPFPRVSKPILLSTVKNEAGPTIYGNFPSPMGSNAFANLINKAYEQPRARNLLQSPYYNLAEGDDARVPLERLGTDAVWRCAIWTFARSWAANGGRAFVAEYALGATYPDNVNVSFCSEEAAVCHEDDIEIVFGTVPNPTVAQTALVNEVQARYSAFMHTGEPSPQDGGYPAWNPATSSDTNAILLGGEDNATIGACEVGFWGTDAVPYDYQVFHI
ncbi:alpha beta-hydrolase [Amylostereum chailletii]|nr:alpha beta-hydrolase [Amylostereum chailletii]